MNRFQRAALAIVEGDIDSLKTLMLSEPGLATARSSAQGATLLHYVGANSPVEDEMQKTPSNAVEIAAFLIKSGCVVDATIGGAPSSTPLVSLVTSGFPASAGLQGQLVELLVASGACVNGLKNDGYPLTCALWFRYPQAINALVACGARVDNLIAAASLGDVQFVQQCFTTNAELTPEAVESYTDPFHRRLQPQAILEVASELATYFQRHEVVEFLRSKQ